MKLHHHKRVSRNRKAIDSAIARTTQAFPLSAVERRTGSQPIALCNVAATAMAHLKPGSRVLDFGAGAGHKSAVLSCLGFDCTAVDSMENARPGETELVLSFANEFGVDFHTISGDVEDPLPFETGSFDMVMIHHVLEHLHDSPRDWLVRLLEFAKPGGLLFVTVPNAGNIRKRIALLIGRTNLPPFESYYWHPGRWTGHVREYVRGDLAKMSEYLALRTLELRGVDDLMSQKFRSDSPIRLNRWLRTMKFGYLFITGIFPAWKDTWLLVAEKNEPWKPKTGEG